MIRVTVDDMAAVGYCVKGARVFAKRYGLDFRAFCRDGIAEDELRATGDALVNKVIDYVKAKNV